MMQHSRSSAGGEPSMVDRRTFLKDIALASAGAVVAPGAVQAAGTANVVVWKAAPCPLCTVGCGLLVGIRDGRAIAVKGDTESPVSRGLACVKGYHAAQSLYGRDRIARAQVRRGGRLIDVPLQEALDIVAVRMRESIAQHGGDSVAVYGSAHWTAADRYIAAKLFRGGIGTNNIGSETSLDAASGAAGLLGSFGMDGAVGSYEDIEHADVFVLWNHNIAEIDPVLFSRMLERRRTNPGVRIIDVTTRTTRTSYAADRSLAYAPHSELALANAIGNEIVRRGWTDRGFVERYVAFRTGATDFGEESATGALVQETAAAADWNDYVRFLEPYAPERVERITGLPTAEIRWLASLYGDRSRRVMSVWGTGVNQHARGTWINNALYNIHLLTGRVSTPGNGALCTTGAADACTAIECAGPLRPAPATAVVAGTEQRLLAARIWGVADDAVDERPSPGVLSIFRALERGAVRFLWVQGADPLKSLPNLKRYRAAATQSERFLVVSDAYPTPTTDAADVVLPAALWIERPGVIVNPERRVQHFDQMVTPPGEAMDIAWQMIEVARRIGYGALFPWTRGQHAEASWQEYGRFHAAAARRLPPLGELRAGRGALWPFIDGRETTWRYNTRLDPAADTSRGVFDFYGHADRRAWIWLRPHQPPAEAPDGEYPFWLATGRVLEHDPGGTVTRRVPTLHRAMPRAYVELNVQDAAALRIASGERVRLVSRRGALEIDARVDHRSQPARGNVFVPSFDAALPVNMLTLDAACPLSGQPDYAACAVRVERIASRSAP
jgi:nitrate reductase (cytochrome)